MLQFVDLFFQPGIDVIVCVTYAYGYDAAQEVQILLAFGVPDVLVFGVGQQQRFREEVKYRREQMFLVRSVDTVSGLLLTITVS